MNDDLEIAVALYLQAYIPKHLADELGYDNLVMYGRLAIYEVQAYCNRKFSLENKDMIPVISRVAANRVSRIGTEGLASQSFSGVSESYIDGLPADVMAILNRKRKVKIL